jgi:5-methyltetrahydrofolate--homocysteine methyltransferase
LVEPETRCDDISSRIKLNAKNFITPEKIMDKHLELIFEAILEGNKAVAQEGVQKAVDANRAPESILNEALIPAMTEVGHLYEEGEYFVPEMLISARAMRAGMVILKPLLIEADVEPAGKVVIGTVQGDLHDIGKNLVSMMLEGAGFEVVDLGTDMPADMFIEAIVENKADILALSALLTTTMPQQKTVIDRLNETGLRDQVKVIVGGAPVTEAYAQEIGANGYAPDAGSAASLATRLVS